MFDVTPIIPSNYLDGSDGPNRKSSPVFSARTDSEALEEFLAYNKSDATQLSYRKECERLMRWARFMRQKALSNLNSDDFRAYQRFVRNPPADWCYSTIMATRNAKGLFKGPLSESAERYAMRVIDSFFGFLVRQNYLHQKPLIHIEKRESSVSIRRRVQTRQLRSKERDALFAYFDANPGFESERLRFAVWMLFGLGLRVGELTNYDKHRMNSFECIKGRWIFYVQGKGGKDAEQPVPPELLKALVRWRRYLGLSDFPDAKDVSPLVVSSRNTEKPIMDRQLRYKLKHATVAASELLEDEESRRQMQACSPHWFRHMYVSELANGKNRLEDVMRCARHEKLDTTMLYMDSDDERRRNAVMHLSL